MSITLVAVIPFALLGVVALLGFIGCTLPRSGGGGWTPPPPTFQDTIRKTPNIVAFWPLNEGQSATKAKDTTGNGHDGDYTPTAAVPYDPGQQSASAPGTVERGQPGLVPGDTINNVLQTCASFQGGFVKVLPSGDFSPKSFTLEAWVRPLALAANESANRVVVACDDTVNHLGFALSATTDNRWNATIGDGTMNVPTVPQSGTPPIVPGVLHFLAMTFDGLNLTLWVWVNPADTSQGPYAYKTASNFVGADNIPFFIGIGHPDLPTPLLPFNGAIQDVAFYSDALPKATIQQHFEMGVGMG